MTSDWKRNGKVLAERAEGEELLRVERSKVTLYGPAEQRDEEHLPRRRALAEVPTELLVDMLVDAGLVLRPVKPASPVATTTPNVWRVVDLPGVDEAADPRAFVVESDDLRGDCGEVRLKNGSRIRYSIDWDSYEDDQRNWDSCRSVDAWLTWTCRIETHVDVEVSGAPDPERAYLEFRRLYPGLVPGAFTVTEPKT